MVGGRNVGNEYFGPGDAVAFTDLDVLEIGPVVKDVSSEFDLHAKTSALDRDRLSAGSFNFDQRSAFLNTEMGIVIESPALAQRLAAAFDENVPSQAYELRVAADGHCPEWIERSSTGKLRHEVDPGTSAAQRGWIQFLDAAHRVAAVTLDRRLPCASIASAC